MPIIVVWAACALGPSAVAAPSGQSVAAPILVGAPALGVPVGAQRLSGRRLTAVVELSGSAQPDAQLALAGACGRVDCEGLTYADHGGRWHTRLRLTTPRGRHDVRVRIAYWPATPAHAPVATRVGLRASVPSPPTAPAPVPAPGADPPADSRPALVMLGDSLAMGTAGPLSLDLPDWNVRFDARIGRPLAEGLGILAGTALPSTELPARTVLAFSLFTNDAPADVNGLDAAVRASVARLGPHDCTIWATISRPAAHGMSYRAANARLAQLALEPQMAGRLLVVPWAAEVARHQGWKAHDHVHATAAGYLARAQLYADAARSCAA
ncbi:MAG: hypothetical protein ACXVRX_10955 [Solirubrobacteraceae bacterium]